jgi:trans-aconitate 2-methyltransferase
MSVGCDWDASTYDRISDPQFSWALEQLERTELGGEEDVLDAGCGSGRVTELLARLTRGRVFAVDAAPSMVAHTQERLGERVTGFCQDLTELQLPEPVDLVFSNATFHWIADHDRLFARLFSALRPGGRLVAQCGGKGNIDSFRRLADGVAREEPFAHLFADWKGLWNYAGAEETAQRLHGAGFVEVETWLEPRPVVLEDPEPFVRTVCLVRHLDRIPPDMHKLFIDRVLARTGVPLTLGYVRLNLTARRPA